MEPADPAAERAVEPSVEPHAEPGGAAPDAPSASSEPAPKRRGRRALATASRVVGIVVVMLLVDLAIGTAWGWVAPKDHPGRSAEPIRLVDLPVDAAPVDLEGPDQEVFPADPREDLPSMRAYPWRHEYFQELQRAPTRFWPYVLWRPLPAKGKYINITSDWERVSYEPPGAGGDGVPDVDFYGGSTTYGEGQRDEHTIPSEVARLAEADGLPIRVHNRGIRGWVNYQELLLFDHLTATDDTRPELAVFYDGANERAAQSNVLRGIPNMSVDEADAARNTLGAASWPFGPTAAPETSTSEDLAEVVAEYRFHSALFRVGGWLKELAGGTPAGAAPAQASDQQADSAAIYRRGRSLIEAVAERTGVEVTFFWQPLQSGGPVGYTAGIDAPTIDISRAFVGHDGIFLDGTHHNEEGSVIAAEAVWEHIKPKVQAWYDDQPG